MCIHISILYTFMYVYVYIYISAEHIMFHYSKSSDKSLT
jgi:hypothetical protein